MALPRTLFLALVLAGLAGTSLAASLNIPAAHPRIWFGNAARLQQARTWYATHPITPGATDYYARALNGVINGNVADCTAAAHYFRDWQASAGMGGFRDDVRQQGEDLLLMFDWCQAQLTPAEISTLVTRWNGYMDRGLTDDLGNAGDDGNNYWAGYTRNYLLWGIASYGVNPRAQEFIDRALDTRMGPTDFGTWYTNFGTGGVFPEGGDYGVVSLAYPLLGFASANDFGYDPYAHTPYYREAIYALIYGTTPAPSTITGEAANLYSLFPFNDDEHFYEGGAINVRDYLGDFATWLGVARAGTGNAQHALAWQALTGAGRRSLFTALGTTGNPAALDALPLDYYAPGAQVMAMRTAHRGASAMQVHLQLGTPGGTEHRHADAGNFQVWRHGYWLTRESTGYADSLAGFRNVGTIDSSEAPAHNTLLFEGRTTGIWIGGGPQPVPPGTPESDQPRGLPNVTRVQHEAQFGYVAVDYSKAYRNGLDTRVDWPYADAAWREFLFLRPLQALLILDRVRGSSDSQRPYYSTANWLLDGPIESGAQVRRTFVMHFETLPTANGASRLDATVGTQKSELITLLPANPYGAANPAVRIFNEDQPGDAQAGQYRLELDTSGTQDAYFINVVTGYDSGEAALTATLQDLGDHWQIALSHPVRGSATVVLRKGMTSTGGSVQFGSGPVTPLRGDVQGIHVTDAGPQWETDLIFANGFE